MALGRKTGGRTKGTPNKKTLDVIERLEELGCDPIEGMAKIAMDDAVPIEVRARMYSERAGCVAPKRKAVEHSGQGSREISISWMNNDDLRSMSLPELTD